MSDFYQVSLSNICHGAAVEKFDLALQEVIMNIQDFNTDAEKVREIILSVKIKPDDKRNQVDYLVDCRTKLAHPKPIGSSMFVGIEDGEYMAKEEAAEQMKLPFADSEKKIDIFKKDKEAQG